MHTRTRGRRRASPHEARGSKATAASYPTTPSAAVSWLETALNEAEAREDGSFGEVFDHFLDFSIRLGFAAGEHVQDPELAGLLRYAAHRVFGPALGPLQGLVTVSLPQQGLRHGAFTAGGMTGIYFWLQRSQLGLLAIGGDDERTWLVRLRAVEATLGLESGAFVPGPGGMH